MVFCPCKYASFCSRRMRSFSVHVFSVMIPLNCCSNFDTHFIESIAPWPSQCKLPFAVFTAQAAFMSRKFLSVDC